MASAYDEEAALALKNSYPREDRGHRLLYGELAATDEDNGRQTQLEEAPSEIGARAQTS
jgi:hypothetical protein